MASIITSSPTNAEILANLLGDTMGLSNIQITSNGNRQAVGLFQDLPVNLSSGVLLSTGRADQIIGGNIDDKSNVSTVFNGSGTAANGSDAITLEITFDADDANRQLFLQYVFGSEEFLDFAGNSFNDMLTLELNGVNLAKLNNGNLVNVNNLTPGNGSVSPDYISNLSSTNPAYFQTVLDGYTVPLTLQGNLLPNAQNRLVITIQDIGDGAVDSAVFLSGGSLGVRNPIPTINVVAKPPGSVSENGGGSISYIFTRTGAINQALSVSYRLGGTATFDTDYSSSGTGQTGTIDFVPGSASATLLISPRIDTLVEGDEAVVLDLVGNSTYAIGSNSNASGLIIDTVAPPIIRLTVNPVNVDEDGSENLLYTFTREGGSAQNELTVTYRVGGTADFNNDYFISNPVTPVTSTVTFSAGSRIATVFVDPSPDDLREGDETVELTLVQAGRNQYTIGTPDSVVGNIIDSPPPPPTIGLFITNSVVGENDQTNLIYYFTRTGSTSSSLTVQYSIGGTASFNDTLGGADYTVLGTRDFNGTTGSVGFEAGSNVTAVQVVPTVDSIVEPSETVILQLDTIGRYTVSNPFGVVGTIVDAATPIINVVAEPQAISEGSSTHLFYSFSRNGSMNDPLTVNYNLSGNATFINDYNQTGASSFDGTSGSITFATGSRDAQLEITAITDVIFDPDETILLTLADSPNYAIGNSSGALGLILDVPAIIPPTISLALNRASVTENGRDNLSYTFTRDGSAAEALVGVRYQITGVAIDNEDYSTLGTSTPPLSGVNYRTFDFAPGASTFTVRVDPTPDTSPEGDEAVSLALLPAGTGNGDAQYILGNNSSASGLILDTPIVIIPPVIPPIIGTTPPVVSLAVNPASVNEDGTANLVYTFTRDGLFNEALRVDYDFGGNAAFGLDYTVTGASSLGSISSSGTATLNIGTVDFAVGLNTVQVIIDPTADSIAETNEIVTLRLVPRRNDSLPGGARSYNIATPDAIGGTIIEPRAVVNLPPTQIIFNGSVNSNTFRIAENTSTTNRIKIADIAITDDQLGTNTISLSGADVSSFELDGTSLFLRSGVALDFETKTNYNLAVSVDDATVGTTPDVVNNFTLIVTDINEPPTGRPIILIDDIVQNTSVRIPRTAFLTGFTDPENDLLNVVNPIVNNGTIVNNSDGTFTLTPSPGYSGEINISYGVTDGVNTLNGQLQSVIVLPPTDGLSFIGTTNLDVAAINPSNGVFALNPNNINLVGDEINLLGGVDSVTVPGKRIILQPDRPNQNIQLGSVDSNSVDILDLIPADLAAIANGFSRIVFGRANGSGNININSAITFRDPILLRSPGGQLNIAAPITLSDDATLDFNVRSLVKSGESILTINGNTTTTFIGNAVINGGTLLLAKAPNTRALNDGMITVNSGTLQLGEREQIDNAAALTLNGGAFDLNGFSETLGQLQVANNSSIKLGNSSSKLAFGNSSSQSWTGILLIENWSSTSGETIRFGNNANGLTAAQLNNIQFAGFGRGATINASGFIAPIGSNVANPAPDQDGVNDDIENLAPNGGDGNLDGVLDSLQENVTSILNLGGVNVNNVATVISKVGTKISGLRSLANPITTTNLASLANPIEFKLTGLANGAATTIEYLIAKADQTRKYNTYLMFGATADNLLPHAYEFLYDGQTGAELFDTNGDGFTDKAVVHFVDGLRGDSDLTANGEIQDPGAPGISDSAVGLSTDASNVVQVTGAAGTAIANFSLVANQTKKVSEVGFFKIDGTNKVRGIAANAAGFAQAALQNGQVIFSGLADNLLSTADISRQLQLNAGDRLGFYLVQNGTVDAALQKNDFSNVVFSLDQANPSGRRVLDVTTESNGSYRLKWEQGDATVADDLILNLRLQSNPLNNQNLVASIQGDKESELLDLSSFTGQSVQVNFMIKREAAYNDTVGFYKIEDAQGTVLSVTGARIKPGETGYQAAVVQNRITGIDLEVANGQTVSIDKVLQGGAIYAPFLIANANPSSLNGNFSNVYTPYALGNSDTTDHVRLLGDNTFGFEDLAGGGDRDFNDVVLKAVFKNS